MKKIVRRRRAIFFRGLKTPKMEVFAPQARNFLVNNRVFWAPESAKHLQMALCTPYEGELSLAPFLPWARSGILPKAT